MEFIPHLNNVWPVIQMLEVQVCPRHPADRGWGQPSSLQYTCQWTFQGLPGRCQSEEAHKDGRLGLLGHLQSESATPDPALALKCSCSRSLNPIHLISLT